MENSTPPSSGLIDFNIQNAATINSENPACTTRLGPSRPASRGPLDEVTNIAIEIGSILMPVSSASNPSTICR